MNSGTSAYGIAGWCRTRFAAGFGSGLPSLIHLITRSIRPFVRAADSGMRCQIGATASLMAAASMPDTSRSPSAGYA